MAAQSLTLPVIDADGHLVESVSEMAEFMEPSIRGVALKPGRNRQGVFPSLDGMHYPGEGQDAPSDKEPSRPRVNASDHRMGSGEDCLAFVDKSGIDYTILYTSEGLSVGFIQLAEYAKRVCRAYNDYVAARYRNLSDKVLPVALLPLVDVKDAVAELRRAVLDLKLPGAMLPSTGLPLHLGHEYYWPVYQEAASLGAFLGIHGGSNRGVGIDTYSSMAASHVLHHPVPLMNAMVSLIYHGVLDAYPASRFAFLEGGCSWLVVLLDRMHRDDEFFGTLKRSLPEYLTSGQILIGCEGDDPSLSYLAHEVGIDPFAYSSDYPHEVDMVAAQQMIERTITREDLTLDQKRAVLADNARRFHRLV